LAAALRLLAATWRVDHANTERLEGVPGTRKLVGFWHSEYFPLLPLLRGIRGTVLIGEGLRGSLIAAIVESFGYTPVLLPHGDRERAVARIRAALTSSVPCATAFDGPIGPARQVKPSLIRLAAEVGAVIVPVSMSASPCWVLRWRWDRREIPLPFARVRVCVGPPISLPADAATKTLTIWQQRVTTALDSLDAACHGQPAPISGVGA
jgi:lysophospholipid acyltransferase (LPLAT)-like uncharacterized protein